MAQLVCTLLLVSFQEDALKPGTPFLSPSLCKSHEPFFPPSPSRQAQRSGCFCRQGALSALEAASREEPSQQDALGHALLLSSSPPCTVIPLFRCLPSKQGLKHPPRKLCEPPSYCTGDGLSTGEFSTELGSQQTGSGPSVASLYWHSGVPAPEPQICITPQESREADLPPSFSSLLGGHVGSWSPPLDMVTTN